MYSCCLFQCCHLIHLASSKYTQSSVVNNSASIFYQFTEFNLFNLNVYWDILEPITFSTMFNYLTNNIVDLSWKN